MSALRAGGGEREGESGCGWTHVGSAAIGKESRETGGTQTWRTSVASHAAKLSRLNMMGKKSSCEAHSQTISVLQQT